MIRTKYLTGLAVVTAISGIALVGTAFAQTSVGGTVNASVSGWGDAPGQFRGGPGGQGNHGSMPMMRPGVFGTVATIDGTTLTVTSRGFGPNASTTPATTYTVDASNATVFKDNATSSISSVAVGDMVFAQGTVSGTSVTATSIRDGLVPGMGRGTRGPGMPAGKGPGMGGMGYASSTLPAGNGQPVIGGTVSTVSGTSLTITNSGGTTYTIDASSAKIERAGTANATFGNISVGDHVIVQGTVNGTSVTAVTVIDQPAAPATTAGSVQSHGGGFFGSIGSFFKRLFGF